MFPPLPYLPLLHDFCSYTKIVRLQRRRKNTRHDYRTKNQYAYNSRSCQRALEPDDTTNRMDTYNTQRSLKKYRIAKLDKTVTFEMCFRVEKDERTKTPRVTNHTHVAGGEAIEVGIYRQVNSHDDRFNYNSIGLRDPLFAM